MNDDKLMDAAGQLSTEIKPERDLWPEIEQALEEPQPKRRWTPMFAQVAAMVMLVSASSLITYTLTMSGYEKPVVVAVPVQSEMIFDQVAFGGHTLGPGFQDARRRLVADLEEEMLRLSPEARQDIKVNVDLIHSAISDINTALKNEPDNILLQEQLLNAYREELALLRRVSSLTRNIMMRNDI